VPGGCDEIRYRRTDRWRRSRPSAVEDVCPRSAPARVVPARVIRMPPAPSLTTSTPAIRGALDRLEAGLARVSDEQRILLQDEPGCTDTGCRTASATARANSRRRGSDTSTCGPSCCRVGTSSRAVDEVLRAIAAGVPSERASFDADSVRLSMYPSITTWPSISTGTRLPSTIGHGLFAPPHRSLTSSANDPARGPRSIASRGSTSTPRTVADSARRRGTDCRQPSLSTFRSPTTKPGCRMPLRATMSPRVDRAVELVGEQQRGDRDLARDRDDARERRAARDRAQHLRAEIDERRVGGVIGARGLLVEQRGDPIARRGGFFDRLVRHERREPGGLDRDHAPQRADQRGLVRELALARRRGRDDRVARGPRRTRRTSASITAPGRGDRSRRGRDRLAKTRRAHLAGCARATPPR
jgi:hypothetical protein